MTNRQRFEAAMGAKLDLEPILYADGSFHYYADRVTQMAWEAWQGACPEGWVILPSKITAETGHKAALMGEFFEPLTMKCPECYDLGGTDEDCDICQGEGEYQHQVPVSWSTIKRIHDAIVAASPKPEDV